MPPLKCLIVAIIFLSANCPVANVDNNVVFSRMYVAGYYVRCILYGQVTCMLWYRCSKYISIWCSSAAAFLSPFTTGIYIFINYTIIERSPFPPLLFPFKSKLLQENSKLLLCLLVSQSPLMVTNWSFPPKCSLWEVLMWFMCLLHTAMKN